MRLEAYHFQEKAGWKFSEIHTRRTNLFVGATGSGKSRLLNTISNVGEFVGSGNKFKAGDWNMEFVDGTQRYTWKCQSTDLPKTGQLVDVESLCVREEGGAEKEIYRRSGPEFFYEDRKLPLLSPNTSGLYLFREEPAVAEVQQWFTNIIRRNFHGDDLLKACAYQSVPPNVEFVPPREDCPQT